MNRYVVIAPCGFHDRDHRTALCDEERRMAVNFANLLTSCAQVRLRRYPRKHRSGVGQFRRIRYNYRLDYLREIFCLCHDIQGKRSFFGHGT